MKNILLTIICIISFLYSALNYPSDNQDLTYIYVLFEWDQEPNATSYNLQVSNQSSFNNIIVNIEETTTSYIDTENMNWDDTYYWKIRPIYSNGEEGNWTDVSTFTILGKQFPEIEADIYNNDFIQDGLVVFGGFSPELASAAIDRNGNEIWNTGEGEGFIMNHINEYGNIYGLSGYDHPNNTGTKINYDLDFLWSAPTTDPEYAVDIHEIKQIPNGNYMAFIPDYRLGPIPPGNWSFFYESQGYVVDGITNEFPFIGMKIVEWDEGANEVWSWNPFDHFSMNHTDLHAGTWWNFGLAAHDWMHSNAFHFDEAESVIYVSHRHLSRISKISYPSGEVIWNIGMPEEYNTGDDNICTDLGNSFQHNIQLLDDGSLLFFDNGNLSQLLMGDSSPISRIRRIRVIDNSYCETEWEYELPPNLFGLGMGSVQLLDNGNYLLYTFGNGLNQGQPTLREVTAEKEVVWDYQGSNAAWYRTYKIPSLHPNAFSVIAEEYTISDNNENIIQISDNSLGFEIINKSGYALEYKYMLSDLMDGETQLFIYDEGVVNIEPYGNTELSFPVNNAADITTTQVMLHVWPIHHKYASKELTFAIELDNVLIGDLNNDSSVNILDVVLIVNIILSSEDNLAADINNDGSINVLDIVELINIILD